jgi:hypothetical protein
MYVGKASPNREAVELLSKFEEAPFIRYFRVYENA